MPIIDAPTVRRLDDREGPGVEIFLYIDRKVRNEKHQIGGPWPLPILYQRRRFFSRLNL
jgi:hypothetical protein